MKELGIIGLLIIFGLSSAMAQLIKVEQEVFGMDCAPCAYGLERGLKKLDGLEKVQVSLNEGKAYLSLSSENNTTLREIQDNVKKNGFSARNAEIISFGELYKSGNEWILKVNSESFRMAADTDQMIMNNLANGRVKLKAVVMDEDDKNLSDKWIIKIKEILPL